MQKSQHAVSDENYATNVAPEFDARGSGDPGQRTTSWDQTFARAQSAAGTLDFLSSVAGPATNARSRPLRRIASGPSVGRSTQMNVGSLCTRPATFDTAPERSLNARSASASRAGPVASS